MADAFRGLTLRIGADVRPLKSAIDSVQRSVGQAQRQLNAMNKALKFDGNNVNALARAVDLAGDKAHLAARAAGEIRTAMGQASSKIKDLADETRHAYSETQRLKSEYNSVNAQLERVHDAMIKRIRANNKELTDEQAVDYFKRLQEEMRKVNSRNDEVRQSAQRAKEEFNKLFREAAEKTGINKAFGQDIKDAEERVKALTHSYETLKQRHRELKGELKTAEMAEGYRAMRTQLVSWESEMRKAIAEATDFKAKMASLGSTGQLVKLKGQLGRIEDGLEQSRAAAQKANAAFEKMPKSIEAARLKALAMVTQTQSLDDKIANLDEQLKKIENDPAFDKQAAKVGNVYAALAKAKSESDKWSVAVERCKDRHERLTRELDELKTAIDKDGEATDQQREKYARLENQIDQTRRAVDRYEDELREADERTTTAALGVQYRDTTVEKGIAVAEREESTPQSNRLSTLKQRFSEIRTMGYGLYSTITPAIAMIGRRATQSAEEVDAAFRDMVKTVDTVGLSEEEAAAKFDELKNKAVEFSTSHVTSASQLLEIEAIGGQLGIQIDSLESFANTVANLDIATNMSAEDIAESLGKMATVLGITTDDYDNFADSLVRLGNNMPAMESDIMNASTRFMGMGKVVGMSADEVLAWATAAVATGQKSEAAGSSMIRFMSNMENAVNGSDEALKKWADVADMSVGEFRRSFKEDASETMYSFIQGLGKMQATGKSVNQTLGDLKIGNVRDKQLLEGLANQMANAMDETGKLTDKQNILRDALDMSANAYAGKSDQWAEAGDAMREAEKKSEGFSGSMAKLRNSIDALGVAFGDGLLPLINGLTGALGGFANAMNAMPSELKTVIAVLGSVAAAAGPATVAVGAVGDGILTLHEITGKTKGNRNVRRFFKGYAEDAAIAASSVGSIGKEAEEGVKKVGKLGGALKTIGKGVAVGGAVVAIGLIVESIGEAIEKAEKFEKATKGMSDVAGSIRDAAQQARDGFEGISSSMFDADLLKESVSKLTEANAGIADSMNETIAEATGQAGKIEYYGELIQELAGKSKEGSENAELLKDAIKNFNELKGSDIKIIDDTTGAVNALNGEIERNIDLMQAKVMSTAFEEVMQQAANAMADTSVQIKQNERIQGEILETLAKSYHTTVGEIYELMSQEAGPGESIGSWQDRLIALHPEIEGHIDEVADLIGQYTELGNNLDTLRPQLESQKEAFTDATNASREQTQEVERLSESNKAIEENVKALAEAYGVTTDEMRSKLSDADVDVRTLAQLTKSEISAMVDSAEGDFARLASAIANIPTEKHITITTHYVTRGDGSTNFSDSQGFGHARGTISPRTIRAVPRNAAGGLNGIVARPTLTNIGWVGEAGAEAIIHMRNAGGAVIPLSNRQYVRPFAQAVASEMGGYDPSAIVNELRALRGEVAGARNLNLSVTVNGGAGEDAAELGRRIGNAAAYELRMQGVCA